MRRTTIVIDCVEDEVALAVISQMRAYLMNMQDKAELIEYKVTKAPEKKQRDSFDPSNTVDNLLRDLDQ